MLMIIHIIPGLQKVEQMEQQQQKKKGPHAKNYLKSFLIIEKEKHKPWKITDIPFVPT